MLSFIEIIVFIMILALTTYGFCQPLFLRIKLIRAGKPIHRSDRPLKRFYDAFASFFFLRGSLKKERPVTGILHAFILFGSLTFDTVSIFHIIEGFDDNLHINPTHLFIADIFAVLVLLAIAYFVIRRYVFRPPNYTYTTNESAIIYLLITTVTLTFLLYEGAVISQYPDKYQMAFASQIFSEFIPGSEAMIKITWWLHIINVFVFVAYVPRSKYIHMFLGPVNTGFQNYNPRGVIPALDIEDEEAEVFGIQNFTDFNWKDNLDSFSCIDCGRCDDFCPATNTAKALSPKKIILNLRDGLLANHKPLLAGEETELLMENTYTADEIWACTTCGACMQVCPMKIEHVPKIIGLRQGEVLMEGKFPNELKNFFNGLNTTGDPWKLGSQARQDLIDELEIPLYSEVEDPEYLLYLGCAATLDASSKRMTTNLIEFLKEENIKFGIIGSNEKCCGETARRIGEEALGQELTNGNITKFNELGVKKIITPCPHCYNTFKNEYPSFGANYEVLHHSKLVERIMKEKQLNFSFEQEKSIVIHDSCYLGRANNIYEPSRSILKNIPGVKTEEHKYSKDHSFCCGAGGAKFWFEDKGEHINHKRVDMLMENNPDVIAVSCPYCLRMLNDGLIDKQIENVEVMDLVTIYREANKK